MSMTANYCLQTLALSLAGPVVLQRELGIEVNLGEIDI